MQVLNLTGADDGLVINSSGYSKLSIQSVGGTVAYSLSNEGANYVVQTTTTLDTLEVSDVTCAFIRIDTITAAASIVVK